MHLLAARGHRTFHTTPLLLPAFPAPPSPPPTPAPTTSSNYPPNLAFRSTVLLSGRSSARRANGRHRRHRLTSTSATGSHGRFLQPPTRIRHGPSQPSSQFEADYAIQALGGAPCSPRGRRRTRSITSNTRYMPHPLARPRGRVSPRREPSRVSEILDHVVAPFPPRPSGEVASYRAGEGQRTPAELAEEARRTAVVFDLSYRNAVKLQSEESLCRAPLGKVAAPTARPGKPPPHDITPLALHEQSFPIKIPAESSLHSNREMAPPADPQRYFPAGDSTFGRRHTALKATQEQKIARLGANSIHMRRPPAPQLRLKGPPAEHVWEQFRQRQAQERRLNSQVGGIIPRDSN